MLPSLNSVNTSPKSSGHHQKSDAHITTNEWGGQETLCKSVQNFQKGPELLMRTRESEELTMLRACLVLNSFLDLAKSITMGTDE